MNRNSIGTVGMRVVRGRYDTFHIVDVPWISLHRAVMTCTCPLAPAAHFVFETLCAAGGTFALWAAIAQAQLSLAPCWPIERALLGSGRGSCVRSQRTAVNAFASSGCLRASVGDTGQIPGGRQAHSGAGVPGVRPLTSLRLLQALVPFATC